MTRKAESKNTLTAYAMMLSSYLVTVVILLAETFSDAPESIDSGLIFLASGLGIWLFKILPLLLFVPGFFSRSHKSAAWLSYVSMLYFILAVLLAFTPGASLWGWGMVLSTIALFISSMLFTRWKKVDER
ncbi:DUF2069 domain-containing protein [Bacterioplanoides sp. SCSIO 12839]|uniref:DUF2069 domain-containing protein n=1 Tax=Bacterioplanoides sp. SCSIO 12839 TaxID=2829569 RepID=UPI0021082378|nr:DUF2069 domain-containing protein [Bacterioplanoides sp. SCSIO 12839]UTW47004.1 DUF2069 domain-containing protein [Bacterioplanoides sp. SCSIO 12839]